MFLIPAIIIKKVFPFSFYLLTVQNPAGGPEQGGAGAGDGVDEGASLLAGFPCGALPQ